MIHVPFREYRWVPTTGDPASATDYLSGAMPWDTLQNYLRRSPLSYVGNVETRQC